MRRTIAKPHLAGKAPPTRILGGKKVEEAFPGAGRNREPPRLEFRWQGGVIPATKEIGGSHENTSPRSHHRRQRGTAVRVHRQRRPAMPAKPAVMPDPLTPGPAPLPPLRAVDGVRAAMRPGG